MKANNKPVLDVITKAIAEWFNEKDNVDDPEKMGKGNKEEYDDKHYKYILNIQQICPIILNK